MAREDSHAHGPQTAGSRTEFCQVSQCQYLPAVAHKTLCKLFLCKLLQLYLEGATVGWICEACETGGCQLRVPATIQVYAAGHAFGREAGG